MSNDTFQHGDRVVVTCHRLHTSTGGLVTDSHEHTGIVSMTSVKGNVYVWLDDEAGEPVRLAPTSLRLA